VTLSAPTSTLTTAARVVVIALAVVVAACTPTQAPVSATPTAPVTPSPTQAATSAAPATPTLSPSTAAACAIGELVARVIQWEGAAGHRIGTVELKNGSKIACTVPELDQPQLVDGVDTVLIDGAAPTSSGSVAVAPGGTLQTLVQTGNYCGAAPIVPVTVAFVFPGGTGRIVAVPLTPEDTGGVPPCNGPGGPGDIEMHPWAP
jgi:hypothetical protein